MTKSTIDTNSTTVKGSKSIYKTMLLQLRNAKETIERDAVSNNAGWFKTTAAVTGLRTTFCNSPYMSAVVGGRDADPIFNTPSTYLVAHDAVRDISKQLFRRFSRMQPGDLEYGRRFLSIGEAVGDAPKDSPKEYCEALTRILFVSSKSISDETKTAAIRYMTFLEPDIHLSDMTKVLVLALSSDSETQAIAAAKTLGEIGDSGAIPVIREVSLKSSNERAKKAMEKAIHDIGSSYVAGTNP